MDFDSGKEEKAKKQLPLMNGGADSPLVLVTDDTPINREMLARQIRSLGLRAETAENGRLALSMWQEGHYSLIVTDCHMPEMDGYELSREVRRREAEKKLPRTPIIAWSGNAFAGEKEYCRQAGMDMLLVKPVRLKELRNAIAKCLNIEETGSTGPEDKSDGRAEAVPIDFDVLEQVLPDKSRHAKVLQDFQEHIRIDHAKLTSLLEQNDLVSVKNIAHRIKGSARMVGARHIADASDVIEQSARDGDLVSVIEAKAVLDVAVCQMETFLEDTRKYGR